MGDYDEITVATVHLGLTGNIVLTNLEPFRDQGLSVRLICPGTGPAIVQSLLAGDAGYANVLAGPVQAAVGGAPLKFVASYQNSGWELWARPDIETLNDLVGKTVGRTSPLARRYLDMTLERQAIDPNRVGVGEPCFSVEPILSGQVDAALLLPPVTVAAAQAGLNCILCLGDVGDPPTYGLVTTNERLVHHRDEVTRVIQAVVNSVQQLLRDRDLGWRLVEALGTPEELIEGALEATLAQLEPTCELSHDSQRLWIETAREATGRPASVPSSQVFDFSIVQSLQKNC